MFNRQLSAMTELVGSDRGETARNTARGIAAEFHRFAEAVEATRAPAWSHVHAWTVHREELLSRAGLEDPYREAKERENRLALAALPAVWAAIRAGRDDRTRLRRALATTLLGNRFDSGSPLIHGPGNGETTDMAARALALSLEPWLHDDADPLAALLQARPGNAILLVDNAGPDFVCGALALALEFHAHGWGVVLAANERPSLNDVTAAEAEALLRQAAQLDPDLGQAVASGGVRVLSTGNGLPGLDLRDVSPALASAGLESDLLVFIGQGRAIETNWRTRLAQRALRVATLKDPMVAGVLGGELLSSVVELRAPGGDAPGAEMSPGHY